MVKTVRVWDRENYLMLTTGYLLDTDSLRLAQPRYPRSLRAHGKTFPTREEATAWTLTVLCRRTSWYRRFECGGAGAAETMPMHTWILGAAERPGAGFGDWFEEKGADYRILIHRTPLHVGGQRVAPFWHGVYRSTPAPVEEREHLTPEQRRVGAGFLRKLLDAYRQGPQEVSNVFQETGHRYFLSEGLRP